MEFPEEIVVSFLCAFSKENEEVGSFFELIQSKIDEMNASLSLLNSANNTGGDGGGECLIDELERQWISLLCLSNNPRNDDTEEMIAQREELIDALISCCDVGAVGDDESSYRLCSRSLLCLSSILRLRNDSCDKSSSLVGSRMSTLAPLLLRVLQIQPANFPHRGDILGSTVSLVQNLLPPRCRREECHAPSVRDCFLLPASSSEHSVSVAAAAQLLSGCIVESANSAGRDESVREMTSTQRDEYNEALSLKKETAALQKIQDFRQVLENIVNFTAMDDGMQEDVMPWSIHDSLVNIYRVAPAALESQLANSEQGKIVLARICPKSTQTETKTNENGANQESQTTPLSRSNTAEASSQEKTFSFYSKLSAPPIKFTSEKQLAEQMDVLGTSLAETDADLWSSRFDALKTLEQILAGGIVHHSEQQRYLFLEKLRRMAITDQIMDLRSQVTRQACRVVTALAYELRETNEVDCANIMSQLVESWLPALLKLSISGVRLMATQGTNCLLHLSALGGNHGYPRIIPTLCEGCIEKKVHQNHRKGCVLALTVALRVWGVHTMEKHLSLIEKAVQAASTNRDPAVREEGRKAFWAMCSRSKFRKPAEKIMAKWDKREKRMMEKVKEETDMEWEKGGRMEILVKTGVDIGPAPDSSSSKGRASKGKLSSKGKIGRSALPPAAARKKQYQAAQAPTTPDGGKSFARRSLSLSSPAPESPVSPRSMLKGTPSSASSSSSAIRLAKKVPQRSAPSPPTSPPHVTSAPSSMRSSPGSPRSSRKNRHREQRPWHRTPPSNALLFNNANSPVLSHKAKATPEEMSKQQLSSPSSRGPLFMPPESPQPGKANAAEQPLTTDAVTKGSSYQISGADTASTILSCEDENPAPSPSSDPALSPREGSAPETHKLSSGLSGCTGKEYLSPSSQQDFSKNEKATEAAAAAAGESSKESPLLTIPPTLPLLPRSTGSSPKKTGYGSSPPVTPRYFVPEGVEQGHCHTATTTQDTPGTDPVLRYMAHPIPLSAEKVPQEKSEILPTIMEKLAIDSAPQEKFLGIQGLVQFAKEHGDDDCWFVMFDDVLDCLLRGVDTGSPLSFPDNPDDNGAPMPLPGQQSISQPLSRKDAMYEALSLCDSVTASRHLYLQGIRALLKYVPSHFESHVGKVVQELLECSKCGPYEVTHTAERALENLVRMTDPVKSLNALLPFLNVTTHENDYSVVLSSLRTLCKLIERLPPPVLLGVMPTLMPCLYMSINHKVVDMRKASVFAIVQLHYVLGDDLVPYLSKLSVAQHKLLSIYIERHKKAPEQTVIVGAVDNKGVKT